MRKICPRCTKEFHRPPNSIIRYCQDCESIYHKALYAANRATIRARRKEQYASNPGPGRARCRAYDIERREENRVRGVQYYRDNREVSVQKKRMDRAHNPQKHRSLRLLRKYGISAQEVERILVLQKNTCAWCGVKMTKTGKFKACVDHCHKSGHVRGIICSRCN